MPSYALSIDVGEVEADDIAALLVDRGATGALVRDHSLEPMPGTPVPAPGRAQVVAFFPEREKAEAALRERGPGNIVEIADQDWGESWKRGLAPVSVGGVFIRPSFIEVAPPAGEVEVVLDPGMAFGTGTHPTTRLCLEALAAILARSPGSAVLDVGTGSGLLAIAAKKLGAGRVVGTDNDPEALRVARENAALNGVAVDFALEPPVPALGHFALVVANILANTLVALAPKLVARLLPGGTVLLSGLLSGQEEEVRDVYLARGLLCEGERGDGEWRLLMLRAPGER
ncbi:MAG TPA: 50S ribosomal protein L11 methyltransferase [Anaeromyxobacteraceae bacterium]|nr:50S ribosomal protein L11 methyltransferase [Anaeromyxobacteraceae bacterium]